MIVNFEIQPEVQQREDWMKRVREGCDLLESKQDRTEAPVRGVWKDGTDEQNQPVLELSLSDWSGSARAQFSQQSIKDSTLFQLSVNQPLRELLAARTSAILDRLYSDSEVEMSDG